MKVLKLQTHKPIMEKKRRARINQSLNEIKALILEALNKDVRKLLALKIGVALITVYLFF